MMDDQTSLGMKIDADVESINNTSHEFLVNFDYLVKLMDEYGFELVDSRLFHEVPNSMLEEFYVDDKPLGQKLKAKTKALEYSILHRWFIFVKRNPTDKEEDEENEKEEKEDEKDDKENEKKEKDEDKEPKNKKEIKKSDEEEEKPVVVVNKDKVKKQSGGYETENETSTLQIEELDLEKIII
jgi:hypothetical protein